MTAVTQRHWAGYGFGKSQLQQKTTVNGWSWPVTPDADEMASVAGLIALARI